MVKKRFIIAIVILLFLITGAWVGRNYLRTFPLYSEVYVEHPDSIKLKYYDSPDWWDYSTLTSIRKQITDYLVKHPNIDTDITHSLKNLSITKGMNTRQVPLVIGEPSKKKILKDNEELWIYTGTSGGVLCWYYEWGKVRFKNRILKDIEVKYIHIHK